MNTNTATATVATKSPLSKASAFDVGTPEFNREVYTDFVLGERPESDLAWVSPEYIAEKRGNLKTVASTLKASVDKVKSDKEVAETKAIDSLLQTLKDLAEGKIMAILPLKDEKTMEVSLESALRGFAGKIEVAVKGQKDDPNAPKVERDHTFAFSASRLNRLQTAVGRVVAIIRDEAIRTEKEEGSEAKTDTASTDAAASA